MMLGTMHNDRFAAHKYCMHSSSRALCTVHIGYFNVLRRIRFVLDKILKILEKKSLSSLSS